MCVVMKLGLIIYVSVLILCCWTNPDGSVKYKHPTENFMCIKCKIGQMIQSHCTENLGNSVCIDCSPGTYNNALNAATQCRSCTDCSKTKRITSINCTIKEDSKCECRPKQYWLPDHELCEECDPPKIVSNGESCGLCTWGTYYNSTYDRCAQCDTCNNGEEDIYPCNITHNVACQVIVHATEAPASDGGSTGAIVGGVVGGLVVLILAIIVVIIYCKKRKSNEPKEPDTDLKEGICASSSQKDEPTEPATNPEEANGDAPSVEMHPMLSRSSVQSSHHVGNAGVPVTKRPEWLYEVITVLCRELAQMEEFARTLPDNGRKGSVFKCSVKWDQMGTGDIGTKFIKFMNDWYEADIQEATPVKIIQTLKGIQKNNVVDALLKETHIKQYIDRIYQEETFDAVDGDGNDVAIQASDVSEPNAVVLVGDRQIPKSDVEALSKQRDVYIDGNLSNERFDSDDERTRLLLSVTKEIDDSINDDAHDTVPKTVESGDEGTALLDEQQQTKLKEVV